MLGLIKGERKFNFFAYQAIAAAFVGQGCAPVSQPDAQFAPLGVHQDSI
jgi:hypothetical protein